MKDKEEFLNIISIIIIFIDVLILFFDFMLNDAAFISGAFENIKKLSFEYSTLIFFLPNFLMICYLIYKIVYRIFLSFIRGYKKIDVKYIRDDLDKITPSYVYFIVNMDLDVDKCVNATILKLIYNKNINIVNNKLDVVDKETDNLNGSEKFILKCLKNKRNSLDYKKEYDLDGDIFKEAYKQVIIKELKEQKYISKLLINGDFISFVFVILMFLIFFVIPYILGVTIKNDAVENITSSISISGFFIVPILIYIVSASANKLENIQNYRRTSKGKNLLHKSLGLKKFLQDFSNIEKVKLEELKLIEFYLIYSIVFDFNNDENKRIKLLKTNSIR